MSIFTFVDFLIIFFLLFNVFIPLEHSVRLALAAKVNFVKKRIQTKFFSIVFAKLNKKWLPKLSTLKYGKENSSQAANVCNQVTKTTCHNLFLMLFSVFYLKSTFCACRVRPSLAAGDLGDGDICVAQLFTCWRSFMDFMIWPSQIMNSMKLVIPLHFISWKKKPISRY